ncbi:MAG TPA: ABC transporter ATP-binding protein [Thermoanaerobaculia bacterium]|nr:ABC transporter ATP-binding protein [Thermoanaerobaculia bacterium]
MPPAVRASGLTKHYAVYRRPADRLIEILSRRSRHKTFTALQDVTFEVEAGETVGVIGQNGAGKSTLLKLLCGVTQPTSGTLHTQGTIASILELGTGFHPEFTGRDNAGLNAAILGLSAEQVKAALPAIIEFSELGSFIDQPVKTYSSGMYMRLAFSVAVNVDPDILVIDEALAVGDGHFQKKCIDRIREFQEKGKTILFCSHALYYVTSICNRTLWLDHGRAMRYGPSVDVVHEYERFLLERDRSHPASEPAEPTVTPVRIAEIEVLDPSGQRTREFRRGDDIVVRLRIASENPAQPIHVIVGVSRSADDLQCFAVGTHQDGLPPLSGRAEYELHLSLSDVPLQRGDYSIIAYVGDEHAMTAFDRRDLVPGFTIASDRFDIGLIAVRHRWDSAAVDVSEAAPAARR